MNGALRVGLLLLALGGVSAAGAACDKNGQLLFACATTNGKHVELCDYGETLAYVFGRSLAQPELALRVPRAQASTWQWQGVGRDESYSVDVPNGNTSYSVFWSRDRMTENAALEAGVYVLVKQKLTATVKCSPESVQSHLQGVDLKPAQ
jgi:hypothetical protein